jgi:hypothetical protein
VQWGKVTGEVIASLYASNGTTLINQVTAATGDLTPGTFAFRAIGSNKYFSTVTDTPGVNNFGAVVGKGSSSNNPGNGSQFSTHEPILSLTFPGIPILIGNQGSHHGTTWESPLLLLTLQEEILLGEEGGLFF